MIEQLRQSIENRKNDKSPEARQADRYEYALLRRAYHERHAATLESLRQRIAERQQRVADDIEQADQRINDLEKTVTQDVRKKLSQTAHDQYDSRKEVDRG